MNASIKVLIKLLLIALAELYTLTGGNLESVLRRSGGVEAPVAALTEIITPVQTAGNRVYYGNLVIDLPDGVTASLQNPWMKEDTAITSCRRGYGSPITGRMTWECGQ